MFDRLGNFIARFWLPVILAWIGLAVAVHYAAPKWEDIAKDGDLAYLPGRMTSVRGEKNLERFFPGPSAELTVDDILNWPGLCQRLVTEGDPAAPDSPGQRLMNMLPKSAQALVRKEAGGEALDAHGQGELVTECNRALARSGLYDADAFAAFHLTDDVKRFFASHDIASGEIPMDEMRRWNRRLVDAAFAGQIARGPMGNSKSTIVLVVERSDGELTEADLAFYDHLAAEFDPEKDHRLPVVSLWTRHTEIINEKLVSADNQAQLIVVGLSTEFMAVRNKFVLERVEKLVHEYRHRPDYPAGLEIGISGSGAIGGDMIAASAESIENTEHATIILVLAILLIVYRAPLLVFIPLATIVTSVFVSMKLVAILVGLQIPLVPVIAADPAAQFPTLHFVPLEVFSTSRVFIVVILFGAGTDFCLFLISRYREELGMGAAPKQAVHDGLANVAHALAASASTTILGLGVMVFADFGKYKQSGPTIGLCLFVALLACVTLAPALLRMGGKWVFWLPWPLSLLSKPVGKPAVAADAGPRKRGWWYFLAGEGLWEFNSRVILAHPGVILAVSMVLIVVLAIPGLDIKVTHDLLSELPPERSSVVGTQLLRKHFPPGDTGPVTVLVNVKEGGLDTQAGNAALTKLSRKLASLRETREVVEDGETFEEVSAGVVDVRSLAFPLGGTPPEGEKAGGLLSTGGRRAAAATKKARARYLSNVPGFDTKVARFEILLASDPFSHTSLEWLAKIDKLLEEERQKPDSYWQHAEFDLLGVTAGIRDLEAVTSSDLTLIKWLVFLAVLSVLLVLLRKPVVCLYLMATVVLSYYVTLSVTQTLFASMYPDFVGLDWKVPLFLFVILVAVGMDYNIYLITRVYEEQEKRGRIEGIRTAVVATGGIITSCGVIMAGTFISMMTGTLRGMMELGFALSFGVLLDTLYVRTILVPAYLVLVERFLGGAEKPLHVKNEQSENEPNERLTTVPQETRLHPPHTLNRPAPRT